MFISPIPDVKPIELVPLSLDAALALPRNEIKVEARLILWANLRGWVFCVIHNGVEYGIATKTDTSAIRRFRQINSMRVIAASLGTGRLTIPFHTKKMRLIAGFHDKRYEALLKMLAAKKLKPVDLGAELGVSRAYITRILSGSSFKPEIQSVIADRIGIPTKDIFPDIPDQYL